MKLDTTQLIGYAAIIVIIISLVSIGMRFTGFATVTDTAVVNVTISSQAAINFTTDFVDFGSGYVSVGQTSATVDTEGTSTGGTWVSPGNGFTLENIGNVNVNLTLKSNKAAATFIGSGASFKVKVVNETEPDSCVNGEMAGYTEILTTDQVACNNFPYANANDEIAIEVELIIPYTVAPSATAKTAIITATGTYTP